MSKTNYYFSDGPYLQVLQNLHRALSSPEALVKLIGNARTGKSTVCEKLALYMRHKGYRVVYFEYAIESPEALRAMLARKLDLPNATNFSRMLEDVPQAEDGKPLIVIFDDAHLLTDTTLLEVYRLIGVQTGIERKLNVVLCGEPSLEQKLLRRKELKSLLMHISHSILLNPMSSNELNQFLVGYLEKAGMPGVLIEPAAMAYFSKCCSGLPGHALALCALIVAARRGDEELRSVGKAELVNLVQQAQNSSGGQLLPGAQSREMNQWVVLGPLAVVVVIASLALLYQQLLGVSDEEIAANDMTTAAPASTPSPFIEVQAAAPLAVAEIVIPELTPASNSLPATSAAALPMPAIPVEAASTDPLSDSDLVLVTAAERGVAEAEVVEPEFEVVSIQADEIVAANPVNTGTAVVLANSPQEPAASLVQVETAPVVEEEAPDTVVQAAASLPDTAVAVATDAVATAITRDPELYAAQADVLAWIAAWQEQNLNQYFASYHTNFAPRYHPSLDRWRQDRQRVIGNAESISLTLSDYVVVENDAERIEVQFWLGYKSSNYADDTLKKLVLGKENAHWLIVEEVNLQVR